MKTIIFDYDGTLTDINIDWKASTDSINTVLAKHNLPTFSAEELMELRSLQGYEALKRLNIPFYKAPFLIPRLLTEFRQVFRNATPYEPMMKVLNDLNKNTEMIGILTSNSKENVDAFLKKHDIEKHFFFVMSNNRLFGKHRSLKKIINEYNLVKEDVYYVGDETRDVDAARRAGIQSIAVTWGINTKEALENAKPDMLLDSPEQLLAITKS